MSTPADAETDHQLSGMTRILGIAASKAGDPERMSEDLTHRAGILCESAECRCAREAGREGVSAGEDG